MDISFVIGQAIYGAIAAAGSGVMFNFGSRDLGWCALSGATTLAVRTCGQELGWSLEGATFAAALTVSIVAQTLQVHRNTIGNALDVAGCIPLVPGSFAAKAIVGLFALTAGIDVNHPEVLSTAVQYLLRVLFTIVMISTGVAIPRLLRRALTTASA